MGYIAIVEIFEAPEGGRKSDHFAKNGNNKSGDEEINSLNIFYSRIRPQPFE